MKTIETVAFNALGALWFLICASLLNPVFGQDAERKLLRRADYLPKATTTREQLIEVAQHYKLPMGIEWVLEANPETKTSTLVEQPTVKGLLTSILEGTPGYAVTVESGIVIIRKPSVSFDSHNFLNLRVSQFKLGLTNVYGAEAELRFRINATLHPERYVGGVNSGFGVPDPLGDGLDVRNISFSGKGMTVREILNRIVLSNGNTFWLVNIAPERMMEQEPFFAQFDAKQERGFFWQILPFGKLKSYDSIAPLTQAPVSRRQFISTKHSALLH